jgi:syntaxin 1A
MVKDRLKDLVPGNEFELDSLAVEIDEAESGLDIDNFFAEIQEIKGIVNEIETHITEVKEKHRILLASPRVDPQISQQLDDLTEIIRGKSKQVKGRLMTIEKELNEENGPLVDASTRIRKTQNAQLSRRFVEVMNNYNQVQIDYKERCKKNLQRQLMITGRNVDDEELEQMLDRGDPVFNEGIILQTQQAKASLQEIEARHADLMKLESSIKELSQMFTDMALLISSQGEMVDNILHVVEHTADYVEKGRQEIRQGKEYQSKARKKKIMIAICLAIFVLILLILLYRFFLG